MRLSDIRRKPLPHRQPFRVGRGAGSGAGCTAGRGNKGAGSRAGAGGRPFYEGGQTPLFRRLPKRGFSNAKFRREYDIVNVESLNGFAAGAEVGPQALAEAGLVRDAAAAVKVLGRGTLRVALKVSAHAFSESAAAKIQQAGGEVKAI